jgi:ABC-type amino acid transport substrate-binding protein
MPCLKAVVIAALAVVAAASATPPAEARPLDDLRAAGAMRITVYRDFFPYSYGTASRPQGVDVEIGREIARRLDLAPQFVLLTADENVDDDLRNGVWKGSQLGGQVGDIMLHVPYDRQLDVRNELAVLFAPYFAEELAVARRAATPTLGVFTEERVGVEIDSISDLYLSGAFGGALRENVGRFLTLEEVVAALKAGEVDAMMAPRGQVEAHVRQAGLDLVVSRPATPGLFMAKWPLGIAVKEDSRDLGYAVADVLAAMAEDGTTAEIFARHGVTWENPRP